MHTVAPMFRYGFGSIGIYSTLWIHKRTSRSFVSVNICISMLFLSIFGLSPYFQTAVFWGDLGSFDGDNPPPPLSQQFDQRNQSLRLW